MSNAKRFQGRALTIDDPVARRNDAIDLRPLLEALLAKHRLRVAEARELQNCWQILTSEGPIINIFSTGSVQLQGQRTHLAREFVEDLRAEIDELRHHRWLSIR